MDKDNKNLELDNTDKKLHISDVMKRRALGPAPTITTGCSVSSLLILVRTVILGHCRIVVIRRLGVGGTWRNCLWCRDGHHNEL